MFGSRSIPTELDLLKSENLNSDDEDTEDIVHESFTADFPKLAKPLPTTCSLKGYLTNIEHKRAIESDFFKEEDINSIHELIDKILKSIIEITYHIIYANYNPNRTSESFIALHQIFQSTNSDAKKIDAFFNYHTKAPKKFTLFSTPKWEIQLHQFVKKLSADMPLPTLLAECENYKVSLNLRLNPTKWFFDTF